MESLCVMFSSLQFTPLFDLPEQFEPVGTQANMTNHLQDTLHPFHVASSGQDAAAPDHSYHTLAAKKAASRPPISKKRKTTKRRLTRRGTVLVVDDVPDVTEMIQLLLKHAGYDVSTAESAKDALRLARRKHYDLVISDIGMPEMNGYELAEALRNLAAYNNTPLIAVTGYSEYDDRSRAVKAGFNVHLTKPIEPTQLLRLMSELLSETGPITNH